LLFLEPKSGQATETDEVTAEKVAESLYGVGADIDRLKIQLVGGEWLVLFKQTVQRATIIVSVLP
jgi:chemotaxis receptor (MCP) glutamine deamidase CheD